jgi:hypothetical protein
LVIVVVVLGAIIFFLFKVGNSSAEKQPLLPKSFKKLP